MIGQLRAASSVIGRRATLKYLMLGAVAATVAACSNKTTPGTSAGQSPTVAALAVEAFAAGKWKVTSTVTRIGYDKPTVATGELTIGAGKWSAERGLFFDDYGAGGEYKITGDALSVTLRGLPENQVEYTQKDLVFAGSGIPATIPAGAFILGWALEERSQTCDTQWDGTTLTIAGNDFYENPTLVTATRV
ncbi:hypothetical protein [Actinoplanes sp. GCM10030250]|uniref:hypothetical protein n=1 Tax=Actinoplanes sp. GCM10030250 TaxID=3273376 RepID=UPI0036092169